MDEELERACEEIDSITDAISWFSENIKNMPMEKRLECFHLMMPFVEEVNRIRAEI